MATDGPVCVAIADKLRVPNAAVKLALGAVPPFNVGTAGGGGAELEGRHCLRVGQEQHRWIRRNPNWPCMCLQASALCPQLTSGNMCNSIAVIEAGLARTTGLVGACANASQVRYD